MASKAVSRRQTLQWLGGTAAGMTVAAACAPINANSSVSLTSATTASGSVRPTSGGTLVYGQLASILNTVPYPANASTNMLRWSIFNPLVSVDERKQPVPALAESWSFSEDRLRL